MKTLANTAALFALLVATATASASERITPIGDLSRGTTATIEGTVERILDEDEFRLSDASGHITVYLGSSIVPVDVGEQVTVSGFVDNDLIKEFYARELVRADGSTHTIQRRY